VEPRLQSLLRRDVVEEEESDSRTRLVNGNTSGFTPTVDLEREENLPRDLLVRNPKEEEEDATLLLTLRVRRSRDASEAVREVEELSPPRELREEEDPTEERAASTERVVRAVRVVRAERVERESTEEERVESTEREEE
jgi:hypothetical protein